MTGYYSSPGDRTSQADPVGEVGQASDLNQALVVLVGGPFHEASKAVKSAGNKVTCDEGWRGRIGRVEGETSGFPGCARLLNGARGRGHACGVVSGDHEPVHRG